MGSINFAVLVSRSRGVDILKFGSGNPGATNVTRALGPKWGKLVFLLDALKGFVAAGIPLMLASSSALQLAIIGSIASIVGHSFSVFLKFRGGKGVATTMGGLLAIMPPVLLSGAVVWVVAFLAFRMVALASILFAVSLPVGAFLFYGISDLRVLLGAMLGILIILRHRSNIGRMLSGKEHKFKMRN